MGLRQNNLVESIIQPQADPPMVASASLAVGGPWFPVARQAYTEFYSFTS